MSRIDFGWEIPTGKRRMPPGGPNNYIPHLRRVLNMLGSRFHSVWVPDHFMDGDRDVPEALTTLSYLSALYPALFWGTVVLGVNYRNPALLAKMAATLQQLNGGRTVLGIGAGWRTEEYRAYNYPFPPAASRIAQLAEAIQICRAMWDPAQPAASFCGEHFRIDNAVCFPKPIPPPPVMIGGAGEQLMLRVVARHADWWNLVGVTPEKYAHKIEVLRCRCAEVGRDPNSIRKTWMGVVSIAPNRAAAEAAMQAYPLWPDDVPIVGTPAEVITGLRRYTALGVDLFILGFADEPALDGIDLFIREVLPAFQE
ncbi:MAG: Phthiodiolone/phenolphthiodiolone dimycocerosates ketoreductase [Anaerolineae bacterium]|nr:Phthiodiolone/phenolphthiodiolone dimycocerosates ketoreductase [Anaerolineae bacterium]